MPLLKNKNLFTLMFLLFSGIVGAQIQSISIGVNGLTCSQCSRSVEMNIRQLYFVKEVKMNLANTEAELFFNEGEKVNIGEIAKAAVDAGFSVRFLKAKIYFKQIPLSENYCWIYEDTHYQFIKTTAALLNGISTVTFIGKNFMPKKEYKIWLPTIKEANDKGCKGNPVYFIKVD